MNRSGHIGISLLAYAPVLGIITAYGYPTIAIFGAGIAFVSSMLPDKDQKISFLTHRGKSHTLASAGIIGVAVAGVTYVFAATDLGLLALAYTAFVLLNRKLKFTTHRRSHTILAGLLLIVGFGGFALVPDGYELWHFAVFCGSVTGLSVVSHIVADFFTPSGVRPFWPVTNTEYALGLFRFDNPIANASAFILGIISIPTAYYIGAFII